MIIQEVVNSINKKLSILRNVSNIVVWGAGENAVRLFQHTNLLTYGNLYIVDKAQYGRTFFGLTVMKPEDIPWKKIEAVVITPFVGIKKINDELQGKYGFGGLVLIIHDNLQMPFYKICSNKYIAPDEKIASVLQGNTKYKNIHTGQRVFILCTGPSISEMDLIRLKDEYTIAVGSFYLHKDYQTVSPSYYCVPTFENFLDYDLAVEYLRNIRQVSLKMDYFFSFHEKHIIDKMEEYKNQCVNYLYFAVIPNYENLDINLSSFAMMPQSVSIMALEIAIYMGFKEIYLLGTEHDYIVTGRYMHFYNYNESIVSKANQYENAEGDVGTSFDMQLRDTYNLWNQYKAIREIARRRGINIYNATKGGVLDVFDRVDYNKLF